jgi:hypothetical protein
MTSWIDHAPQRLGSSAGSPAVMIPRFNFQSSFVGRSSRNYFTRRNRFSPGCIERRETK